MPPLRAFTPEAEPPRACFSVAGFPKTRLPPSPRRSERQGEALVPPESWPESWPEIMVIIATASFEYYALSTCHRVCAAFVQGEAPPAGPTAPSPAGADSAIILPAPSGPEPLPMTKAAPAPFHILVVDDEPDVEPLVRQCMRRHLRSGKYALRFAGDGAEALDILSGDVPVDMVVTDINMPKLDGLSLLAELPGSPPRSRRWWSRPMATCRTFAPR